jgi:hypothetical protein
MQKLNIKKKKEKKHGISCKDKWSRWDFLNKKKNSLNKRFCTKSQKIIGFKEQRFL